jgi:hypothetical protein
MRTLLATVRRSRNLRVGFCESCSEVCDNACRASAQRDRTRTQAITYGLGIR